MKEYATADIADIVGIAKPTVNKYSRALEKAGYRFTKNERGHRIYTDDDIEILIKMKERSEESKMPTDKIADMLLSEVNRDTLQHAPVEEFTIVDSDTLQKNEDESDNALYIPDEFKKFFDDKFDALKKDFQKELEDRFNFMQREQERLFIKMMNETKKQIAVAEEKQKKPSLWGKISNFFKK